VANEVTLKNNIEMDLKDQRCKNLGWIRLIQDRVGFVNVVTILLITKKAANALISSVVPQEGLC
jgi:hypothetical protein